MDSVFDELLKGVGTAAPIVGLLFYIFRGEREERQKMTEKFLTTLENVATQSLVAITESNQVNRELTDAVHQLKESHTIEHRAMMDELKVMGQGISQGITRGINNADRNNPPQLITPPA